MIKIKSITILMKSNQSSIYRNLMIKIKSITILIISYYSLILIAKIDH